MFKALKGNREFIFFIFLSALGTTAGFILAPVESRYLTTLTDNSFLIGSTFAVASVFFAFCSIFLGRLADYTGRGRMIKLGFGVGILYPLLFAAAMNVYQFMGVKLLWAVTQVTVGPILYAYLQDMLEHKPNKGELYGYLFSLGAITGSVGSFLGGWVMENFGFHMVAYVMTSLFALGTAIAYGKIKGDPKPKQEKKKQARRGYLFGFHYFIRNPPLLYYWIFNLGFGFNFGIKMMLWPLIIYNFTQNDFYSGLLFAAMGIMAFLVLPYTGKLIDKVGYYYGAFLFLMIFGVTGLVMGFAPNYWVFLAAASLFAIGEAINGPTQAVLFTDNVESAYRGEIMGIDYFLDQIQITLAPLLAGWLLTFFSPQEVYLFYVGFTWVILAVLFVFYRFKIVANTT